MLQNNLCSCNVTFTSHAATRLNWTSCSCLVQFSSTAAMWTGLNGPSYRVSSKNLTFALSDVCFGWRQNIRSLSPTFSVHLDEMSYMLYTYNYYSFFEVHGIKYKVSIVREIHAQVGRGGSSLATIRSLSIIQWTTGSWSRKDGSLRAPMWMHRWWMAASMFSLLGKR